MLQELDDAVVEFGLEDIVLVEEIHIDKDVDTEQMHTRSGKTKMVAAGVQWTAEFVTGDRLDRGSLMEDDGVPKPKTVTITGIKTPDVVKMKQALVTAHKTDLDKTRIEIIAEDVEAETLW